MNITRLLKFKLLSSPIAILTILAVLFWMLSIPTLINLAQAAALTDVSDTLSDSDLNVGANHSFAFTTTAVAAATETIKIQFDPSGDAFDLSSLVVGDISATGMTIVGSCGAGSDEVIATIDATAPDESITLTVCAGQSVPAGALTVTTANNNITNPASAASYIISIGGTMTDSGDTRVAIIDNVVVTASVDTTFTFTIGGVVADQTINGDVGTTTAADSTATTLAFGTLLPGVQHLLAQSLAVTTNATNGFVVTVVEDLNLTSATGADINLFIDGAADATPVAWQAPAGTLGTNTTYGHFGVTSEDDDLNSASPGEFGVGLYAGNIATARQVFSHDGPADGSTADQGSTRVGFKIQINALQEAGNDYTNTLTYVATPTF